jgi:ABC-type multidrug transport system ATPase subunit
LITIQLKSAGKKFLHQWIFRNLNFQIAPFEKIAITGFNGSGKSTLLQTISGFQTLNEGTLQYFFDNVEIKSDDWYKKISLAAPYLDLHEEYNMHELISFYSSFKPFLHSMNEKELISIIELDESRNKPIKHFSSGMKQRIKLALAVLSDVPVLLLDEPLSNLDKKGVAWYKNLINEHTSQKTIIICSNNIEDEISFCERRIDLHDFKM